MKIPYIPFLTCFLLSSCTCNLLTVHTDYVSRDNLASYHVGTPDPLLNNPPIGQRLLISWSLPKAYMYYESLHLEIHLRYRNREEATQTVDLLKNSGMIIFSLLNEAYFETEGILSYKIDLIGNGEILEHWQHQIWADLIHFDASEKQNETEEPSEDEDKNEEEDDED